MIHIRYVHYVAKELLANYCGRARSKGFATLRNVSKLTFLARLGTQSLQVFGFIWVFDEVKTDLVRDISRSLRFLWFIL